MAIKKKVATGVTIALIYTRVSSDQQAETGVSLPMQLQEARRYAANAGMVIGKEFNDVLSGKRDDRPGYVALLDEARRLSAEGRRVAIVVWKLDRLGRRLLERVQRSQEMAALGCEVHSVTEGLVNGVLANFMAVLAEEEIRQLGQRVAGANRQVRSAGWWPVRKAPFGYRLRHATPAERATGAPKSVLEIDPVTAPMVEAVYRRVADGQSIRSTARWMASQRPDLRGDLSWGKRTLQCTLASATYVARNEPEDGGDVLAQPVGKWPAIISDELYLEVQAVIASHRVMPAQASGKYLLTGLAKCPRCGESMSGQPRPVHQADRYMCTRFRCYGAVQGPSLDTSLMSQVVTVLEAASRLDPSLRRALERKWEALRRTGSADPKHVARQKGAIEKGRTRLANAATMFVDGDLDRAGYDAMRETIERETRAAQDELDRLEATTTAPTLPPLSEALARVGTWATILETGDIPSRRRMLVELVTRVDPMKVGHGRYEARITWTELGEALRTALASEKAA
jgi:DNA invertase Pin-like site-specific DNA recombinase